MRAATIVLSVLLASTLALAGGEGWHSSGGELFRDQKNPWFVRNSANKPYAVRYCIQVDPSSMSLSEAQLRQETVEAIKYWRNEFDQVPGRQLLEIGLQTFEETDCVSGTADLSFKFGIGTLSDEEKTFLKDPRRYIGVAVRTHYDPVELKGKGFIYIASDLGPQSYDTNSGSLIAQAWKHPRLVNYAILHELGHIFGLPHSGSGLMSEVFFDQLLNRALYEIFLSTPLESFFTPAQVMRLGGALTPPLPLGPGKAWLGVPLDSVQIEARQTDLGRYAISSQGPDGTWRQTGVLEIKERDLFDIRDRPAIYLHLNPQQKVFSEREANFRSIIEGPWFIDYGADALYTPVGSTAPKSARVRITSSSFQIIGQQSGKLIVPFLYNSLIGAKMTIPPTPSADR